MLQTSLKLGNKHTNKQTLNKQIKQGVKNGIQICVVHLKSRELDSPTLNCSHFIVLAGFSNWALTLYVNRWSQGEQRGDVTNDLDKYDNLMTVFAVILM